MTRVIAGEHQPDESHVCIRVVVPEEFVGDSIGAITSHRGRIVGIDSVGNDGERLVRGWIASAEFAAVAEEVSVTTTGRGRVEIES